MIVTDADGKPVKGLTQDDFAVFEDKKAQRLTNFVYVEGRLRALRASAPPATPGPTAAEPRRAPPQRSPRARGDAS